MMARASNNMEKKEGKQIHHEWQPIACKHMYEKSPLNGKSIEITNVQVDW